MTTESVSAEFHRNHCRLSTEFKCLYTKFCQHRLRFSWFKQNKKKSVKITDYYTDYTYTLGQAHSVFYLSRLIPHALGDKATTNIAI